MNAQEHYREAERLLEYGAGTIEVAQLHATLALAAATGLAGSESERRAWLDCTDDDAHRAVRA